MVRKKKKKYEDEYVDELWFVFYVDIFIFFLVLFIVLYVSSLIDVVKFQMFLKLFNEVFIGGIGVMDYFSVIFLENELDGIDEVEKDKEEKEKNKKEKEKVVD